MTTSQNRKSNQDEQRGLTRSMQIKLAITGLVILLALIALIITLGRIQNDYSDEYNQKILSQQRYDLRDIPARRGDITDRNGSFLATSTKVYNIIIDPSQINSNQENYLEPTIALLNEVFGYDTGELRNLIIEKSDSAYVRYAKEMTFDQKTAFETRRDEINNEFKQNGDPRRVYGIWFEDAYHRYYPNDSAASCLIGFSFRDGLEGSGGIEQYYNDELTGVNGREYGYLNEDSALERVIKPAQDGNTIVSTIDINIQNIVEKYLKQFQDEMGSKTAACIIMNPKNGEILAMANSHPYNLNDPRDISAYYTEEELAMMDEQQLGDAWNSVWRNFCVTDTYEPGSTSKIFTVAAALDEGSITGSESYLCEGYKEVGGWKIRCNVHSGHGWLNVTESIMQSCNVAMMKIVEGLGKEKFTKFLHVFGFGEKSGIDLPGEPDTAQFVRSPSEMYSSDLATNAFGQNYNCTMVQMAAAYASVINGGSYYEPHVVRQILNSQGSVVRNIEPKLVRQTISPATSVFIKNALYETVAEGTGKAAQIPGYHIGGKTGTAEKFPRDKKNYVVSFIGCAPVEDPQVLCYVVVDEPNTDDQAHSTFASNVFNAIMREVLPYMNIFREGDDSDYEPAKPVYFGIGDPPVNTEAEQGAAEEEAQTEAVQEAAEEADAEDRENSGQESAEPETKRPYDTEEHVEQAPEGEADMLPGTPAGVNTELVPELTGL